MAARTIYEKKSGIVYRTVGVVGDYIVLHDISDNELCTFDFMEKDEFFKKLEDREMTEVDDPFSSDSELKRHRELSEKTKLKARNDYKMVNEIVQTYPDLIYFRKKQPAIFNKCAEKYGMSPRTVRRKFSRYFSRGMSVEALYPDYWTESNMPERTFRNKTGKKTNNTMPPVDYADAASFVENRYADFANKSKKQVWTEYINEKCRDENGNVTDQYPSYAAISRLIDQISPKKRAETRTSAISYFNNVKPVRESCRAYVNYPLDQVEFDNTIVPIYLVSEEDRSKCVGKPVLSVLIDVATQMILAINVSLQGCSYINSAYRTLISLATPFSEIAEKYGLDPSYYDWIDIDCLPKELKADKAELYSDASWNVVETGIELANPSTGHARAKNTVEHIFDLYTKFIQTHYEGKGAVVEHISERESRDYRKEACMTLTELTERLYMFTEYLNHRIIDFDSVPREVFLQEVKPVPVELFRYGMHFQEGSLKKIPEDYRMRLLPVRNMKLSKKGLELKNIRYVPDSSVSDDWILRKIGNKKSASVQVKVNEMDLNRIFVVDKGDFIPFRLTTPNRHYGDLTWEEYMMIFEEFKKSMKRLEPENVALMADLNRDLDKMDKGLKAEPKVDIKNIRENQKKEGKLEEEPITEETVAPFNVFTDQNQNVETVMTDEWDDYYSKNGF